MLLVLVYLNVIYINFRVFYYYFYVFTYFCRQEMVSMSILQQAQEIEIVWQHGIILMSLVIRVIHAGISASRLCWIC